MNAQGEIKMVGEESIHVNPEAQISASLFIVLPRTDITETKHKVFLEVLNNGEVINKVEATFAGPIVRK